MLYYINMRKNQVLEKRIEEIDKMIWGFIQTHRNFEYLFDSLEDWHSVLMLHVIERIDKFDPNRSKLVTYVYVCCWSKCLLVAREKKRELKIDYCLNNIVGDERQNEMVELIADENGSNLDDCVFVKEIKPKICDELKMYIDGYTQNEISQKIGLSQSGVIKRIINNKQDLKKYAKVDTKNM